MTETSVPEATDGAAPPGRPVRLVPTPPGFWRLVLGLVVAAFAPLFGFLIGSMVGPTVGGDALDALYWGLFGGFIVGGLGVLAAVHGGWRLWGHHRRRTMLEEQT